MKHRPEIDGLRAIAVVPVILYHAGFEAFGGGYIGVDVFFVISGYLITTIISEEISRNSFSLRKFYERRARRILPALLLICLVCVPFALAWMSPPGYQRFSMALMAVTVFSSNILFWRTSDYFAPATDLNPLVHTWSLAVEEQFYVFFPLLLLLIRRLSRNTQVAIILLGSVLSLGFAIVAARFDPTFNFYLIPSRAWELGVGALLALTPYAALQHDRRIAAVGNLVGLGLIIFSVFLFDEDTPFPSQYTLVPVAGTALLIVYGGASDAVARLLRLPIIVGVGLISYSLYLWHQPILAFLKLRSLFEPSTLQIAGAIVLTVVLSILSWKFVESPFRRRDRVGNKALVSSAVAASLLIMSIGAAGRLTHGFNEATPERIHAAALAKRLRSTKGLSQDCDQSFTLAEKCRTGKDPELLVWGDSFAMHLVAGLEASRPGTLIQMTKSMCGPIAGVAPVNARNPERWSRGCLKFNEQVLEWVKRTPSVKYAVLSSPFEAYMDSERHVYTADGTIDSNPKLALEQLAWTLDELERLGVAAVVVSGPPSFGGDVARCLATADSRRLPASSCDFQRADYEKFRADTIEFLRSLDDSHEVVWLSDAMCNGSVCNAMSGDTVLYADASHLTWEGSIVVASKLRLYEQVTRRSAALQSAR